MREEIELIGYMWKLQVGKLSSRGNLSFLNTEYRKQITGKQTEKLQLPEQ